MPKLSTEDLYSGTKADLDRKGAACRNGTQAFCTDGRKIGEAAGAGTGVVVWYDETLAVWIDYRTSVEVLTGEGFSGAPYGEIDNNGTPLVTTLTTAGVFYPLAGDTILEFASDFDMPVGGELRYRGAATAMVESHVNLDYTSNTNNHDVTFQLRRNGDVTSRTHEVTVRKGTAADRNEVSLHGLYRMETDDYLEVWVSSNTAGVTITKTNFGLTAIVIAN